MVARYMVFGIAFALVWRWGLFRAYLQYRAMAASDVWVIDDKVELCVA